jgi:hypothetical protein
LRCFGAVTTACVSTQELTLAPNVVQLDTHASGALFAGQATTQTMKRAAELTLQNGYTHFRLENAHMSQGSQLAAVYSTESGNTLAIGYGGATFATELCDCARVALGQGSIARTSARPVIRRARLRSDYAAR